MQHRMSPQILISASFLQISWSNARQRVYGGTHLLCKGVSLPMNRMRRRIYRMVRTPSFQGIIPGGQSFAIPEGNLTTVPEEGLGFDWSPSVRTGTTVLLIGGDNRGMGSGGSGFYIMSQGQSTSCLNSQSPSSTPGSPAGGSYPTSTNGASTNPSTGGGTSR